jgi:hypothetical protein
LQEPKYQGEYIVLHVNKIVLSAADMQSLSKPQLYLEVTNLSTRQRWLTYVCEGAVHEVTWYTGEGQVLHIQAKREHKLLIRLLDMNLIFDRVKDEV